jgi:hypothetical protein
MGFVLRRLRGFCNVAGGYGTLAFTAPMGGWVVPGITAYARLAGIALLVVAAAGIALFGWDAAATYYHAGVGLLFLYVGVSGLEGATVRRMIGGLGALVVVVTAVGILASWLLPTQYLHGPIEVTGLIVGTTSILAARYLPDQRSRRRRRGY